MWWIPELIEMLFNSFQEKLHTWWSMVSSRGSRCLRFMEMKCGTFKNWSALDIWRWSTRLKIELTSLSCQFAEQSFTFLIYSDAFAQCHHSSSCTQPLWNVLNMDSLMVYGCLFGRSRFVGSVNWKSSKVSGTLLIESFMAVCLRGIK